MLPYRASLPMSVQATPPIMPIPKRVVNDNFVDQAIRKTGLPLVLDDDAKSSIMFYMERYVDKLLKETTEATKLRDSKTIESRDVEFALQTKFGKDSANFR